MRLGKVFMEEVTETMARQQYLTDFFSAIYSDTEAQCRVRPDVPPPRPVAPRLPPRPVIKTFCPYCGRRVTDDLLECPGCGAPQ